MRARVLPKFSFVFSSVFVRYLSRGKKVTGEVGGKMDENGIVKQLLGMKTKNL